MERCQDMKVYNIQEVIINYDEKDEKHAHEWESDYGQAFTTREEKVNTSERDREMRRKFNIIDVGIKFFLILW